MRIEAGLQYRRESAGENSHDELAAGDFAEHLGVSENPLDRIIHILLGDLQRIRVHWTGGFQIPVEILESSWKSHEALVALGFDKHLLPPENSVHLPD